MTVRHDSRLRWGDRRSYEVGSVQETVGTGEQRAAGAAPADGGRVHEGVWVSAPYRESAADAQALILVDAQSAFLTGSHAVPDAAGLTLRLAALLERARAAGAVVVHLRNDGEPGAVDEPGSPGWELLLPVRESDREHVVRKDEDDGFAGTGLAELLRGRGVGRVVIAGVLSEMCVSATAAGAVERGFAVVLPHDTHATYGLDDIPAPVVSRVAEHALGDDPELVRSADRVGFTAPSGGVPG
ncbi:putative isochorismatase [Streptomyces clavuligerus]|uniref:Putative isochorismatase n=1 Tax=Streptomyces clavuligerus TaxID=1901 RepID=E2PY58_STRCL|nr:putative isochorismatase [Streptomyces clavuligerus]